MLSDRTQYYIYKLNALYTLSHKLVPEQRRAQQTTPAPTAYVICNR